MKKRPIGVALNSAKKGGIVNVLLNHFNSQSNITVTGFDKNGKLVHETLTLVKKPRVLEWVSQKIQKIKTVKRIYFNF